MRSVHVPCDHQFLTFLAQRFAVIKKGIIKIHFKLQSVRPAGPIRKVYIKQIEVLELGAYDAAFHVEFFDSHPQMIFFGFLFTEDSNTTVAPALGWVPYRVISFRCDHFIRKVVWRRLNLLKAHHVRRFGVEPVHKTFSQGGTHTIDIPTDNFHTHLKTVLLVDETRCGEQHIHSAQPSRF